ncbi:ferredoxin [uncultured Methanomethylovorans sp.]|uniref:ferredoxin n=1 Tax=uncultured Methanomethylovorans sp. TaxID=183759 RepID=UPI002AA74AF2|nr:ferredoxin [uncultured Methanomethylovorans sp.]
MADKNMKVFENVPGPYFVDTECIACELCVDGAPNHFKMVDNKDNMPHACVFKQPENDEEKENCEDAMGACPVDAIGDNG